MNLKSENKEEKENVMKETLSPRHGGVRAKYELEFLLLLTRCFGLF